MQAVDETQLTASTHVEILGEECPDISGSEDVLVCPQYFVTGRVFGNFGKFLIDNGGGLSMISEEWFGRLSPQPQLKPLHASLTALNQGHLTQLGLVQFPLVLGKNKVTCSAAVVRGLPLDGLLGAEFFKRFGVTIDMGKNRLKFASGSSVPMQELDKAIQFGVVVPETVVVPAKHEMIFPSRLNGDFESEGLVEGHVGFENSTQIMVARVSVLPRDNVVPVRVVNATNEDLTIAKGTQIGIFTEVN